MKRALAVVLWALAFGGAGFGFYLVYSGANPPDGNGSLGHLGMIIAGVIAGFLALIFGLSAFALLRKSRQQ